MLLIKNALLPDFDTLTTAPADLLIENGRFAAIAPQLSAQCDTLDAHEMLALPGMADIHTHMVQSLTKGPLDDMNITQWLQKMLAAQWSLTADEWYYGVLLGCLQSLRYGVTAVNEMTYFPHIDAVVQAYQDAGLRVTFGIGATDIAENDQIKVTSVDECLRQAEYLYDRWHGKGLLRTAAVPQGRPACTPELMTALKRFARERGLVTADKRDSQDLCFAPDGDYAAFLERFTGKAAEAGDIRDETGRVLGRHRGLARYTLGQHRGLGLPTEKPLYVCGRDTRRNTLTVGPEESLLSAWLTARECNWIALPALTGPRRAEVQTRYHQRPRPGLVRPLPEGGFRVEFDTPQRAPAPGQTVVLYDGDTVLGAGTIDRTERSQT